VKVKFVRNPSVASDSRYEGHFDADDLEVALKEQA